LEVIMSEYLAQLPRRGQEMVIVIDGKTVRGTITLEDRFGLHLLAAYLPGEGIVLMQMEVEKDKENEIVVAPKLLQSLDLRNKVVIGDAMHTQRQISAQIVEAGGDFVWIVKDNQANTRRAIEQLFAPEKSIPGLGCPAMDFESTQTTEKQAGRIETRKITVSSLMGRAMAIINNLVISAK
jgi:predicted transposase YbfD/YdcC